MRRAEFVVLYHHLFPRSAQVAGELTDQRWLGVGGNEGPCPDVIGLTGCDVRSVQAQGLLQKPECLFQVRATQIDLVILLDPGCIQIRGFDP